MSSLDPCKYAHLTWWQSPTRLFVLSDTRSHRIRARKVDEAYVAGIAARQARETGMPYAVVRHGGSVCNSYGYPAETEAVVALATPDGTVYVWAAQIPANKVTEGGAADVAGCGLRPLFDRRYHPAPQERREILERALMIAQAEKNYCI